MSEPTGAARRRGPFKVGDQVQLTDPKGRHYTFTLEEGKASTPTRELSPTTS